MVNNSAHQKELSDVKLKHTKCIELANYRLGAVTTGCANWVHTDWVHVDWVHTDWVQVDWVH